MEIHFVFIDCVIAQHDCTIATQNCFGKYFVKWTILLEITIASLLGIECASSLLLVLRLPTIVSHHFFVVSSIDTELHALKREKSVKNLAVVRCQCKMGVDLFVARQTWEMMTNKVALCVQKRIKRGWSENIPNNLKINVVDSGDSFVLNLSNATRFSQCEICRLQRRDRGGKSLRILKTWREKCFHFDIKWFLK